MRDFVNKYIEDKLWEYEDCKTTKYDLPYLIMERAFADETLTYDAQESIDLIHKYWYDIEDLYYDNIIDEGELVNPFKRPELFLVQVVADYVAYIVNKMDIPEEDFVLDYDNIHEVVNELWNIELLPIKKCVSY